jgi:hypothetical protein
VCLIARHFESRGLPTLIVGSALDIMESGKPPRAQFLNYPLGFESGRFNDRTNQLDVIRQALKSFDDLTTAGVSNLDYEWTDGWNMINNREKGQSDHRSPRSEEPQYQTEADRIAAEQ